MLDVIGNGRPAGDILSRVVRLTLGGQVYELPVLTIGGNRRWKAELDARLTGLLDGLEAGGESLEAIWAVLNRQVDDLMDLLIAYDKTGKLPAREVLDDTVYEDELLAAVREVWRVANPLAVGTARAALIDAVQGSVSSPSSSSRRRNTAGSRKNSRKN